MEHDELIDSKCCRTCVFWGDHVVDNLRECRKFKPGQSASCPSHCCKHWSIKDGTDSHRQEEQDDG